MLSSRDLAALRYLNRSFGVRFLLNFFIPLDLNYSLREWRSKAACELNHSLKGGQLEFN